MTTNQTAPTSRPNQATDNFLLYSAWAYAIGMVVHGTDHAFRGLTGDDRTASWPGPVQLVMAVLTLAISALAVGLVRSGHRQAPLAAMVIGLGSANVFFVIHVLPSWASFTDSFIGAEEGAQVSGYSWGTATLGIAGALWLGIAGVRALRR